MRVRPLSNITIFLLLLCRRRRCLRHHSRQIRCRVDSITYTSITNTDKGRQATKTSTENSATAAKVCGGRRYRRCYC